VNSEPVRFRTQGGWELAGNLLLPEGAGLPVVVFAHGLGSSKDSPRNLVIATQLADAGIAALLIDLTGHGESEGIADAPLTQFSGDVAAAVRFAGQHPRLLAQRIGISGSSLGGTAALDAVVRLRVQARALVLRAPPLDSYAPMLASLQVPTLLIAGSGDPLLPMLRRASLLLPRGSALRIIEGGGHLFEEAATLAALAQETVQWFIRHLGADASQPEPEQAASKARGGTRQ
jgi:pimeloyl-ACP methyl ester carboxylesterase